VDDCFPNHDNHEGARIGPELEKGKMESPSRTRGSHVVRAELAPISRLLLSSQHIIHNEVVAGASLFMAAIIALCWANSPWQDTYQTFVGMPIGFSVGSFTLVLDLRHWVNDGLMVIFFFVVGLEIKREFVDGELAEWRSAIFPLGTAIGGMIVPALLYWGVNRRLETAAGWGVPIPTDIAFALGVLALLGNRIPMQLRIALLALAVVDDIGAILVIALFYASSVSWLALASAVAILGLIAAMRSIGVRTVALYVGVGAAFWLSVQLSGVHATIAGVILGALTPASAWFSHPTFADRIEPLLRRFKSIHREADTDSASVVLGQIETLTQETEPVLDRLQRIVSPWVSYGVLPLFALVNSGVTLSTDHIQDAVSSPVTQGVLFGLCIGKPLGVLGASWLMVQLKVARVPSELTWTHLWGLGILAGIGFTVSLFVTGLAFGSGAYAEQAKIGILTASFLAATLGSLLLYFAAGKERSA
jgi:NhaA family Na+:H+ antiporter